MYFFKAWVIWESWNPVVDFIHFWWKIMRSLVEYFDFIGERKLLSVSRVLKCWKQRKVYLIDQVIVVAII